MKKSELVSLIENIVRKEVRKQIDTIFISEGIRSIKKNNGVITKQKSNKLTVKPKIQKKKPIRYTSNVSLNDILNETKGGLPSEGKEEYPTMGGGTFDSSRMSELLGYGKSDEGKRNVGAVETIKNAGLNVDEVPEHVTDALTRDYSDLMKAMDKKKRG